MPNREVATKPLSHRLGSAGTLALYRMTEGGEGSKEISISFVDPELGTSSMETRVWEREREKL